MRGVLVFLFGLSISCFMYAVRLQVLVGRLVLLQPSSDGHGALGKGSSFLCFLLTAGLPLGLGEFLLSMGSGGQVPGAQVRCDCAGDGGASPGRFGALLSAWCLWSGGSFVGASGAVYFEHSVRPQYFDE